MTYTHKERVHISSIPEGSNPFKVWKTEMSLCGGGYDVHGDRELVVSLADLRDEPLGEEEELCPACVEHPDYPLLVLADVGE